MVTLLLKMSIHFANAFSRNYRCWVGWWVLLIGDWRGLLRCGRGLQRIIFYQSEGFWRSHGWLPVRHCPAWLYLSSFDLVHPVRIYLFWVFPSSTDIVPIHLMTVCRQNCQVVAHPPAEYATLDWRIICFRLFLPVGAACIPLDRCSNPAWADSRPSAGTDGSMRPFWRSCWGVRPERERSWWRSMRNRWIVHPGSQFIAFCLVLPWGVELAWLPWAPLPVLPWWPGWCYRLENRRMGCWWEQCGSDRVGWFGYCRSWWLSGAAGWLVVVAGRQRLTCPRQPIAIRGVLQRILQWDCLRRLGSGPLHGVASSSSSWSVSPRITIVSISWRPAFARWEARGRPCCWQSGGSGSIGRTAVLMREDAGSQWWS